MFTRRLTLPGHLAGLRPAFRAILLFSLILAGTAGAAFAQQFELKPFKDKLFAYPRILESEDSGAYVVVDYRELRDINRRDSVPEKRVRRTYVDLAPRHYEADRTLPTSAGDIRFIVVGNAKSPKIVTFYIHGRGGDRTQGANDFTFGGNFNRIKNLMLRNSGFYIAPDGGDLGDAAIRRIRDLILAVLRQAPGARAVIACGSAGGAVCHALAREDAIAMRLVGIALLGSFGSDDFIGSAAWRYRVPLFIAHGGSDSVIPVDTVEAFYRKVRQAPDYPVRMVLFRTGGHGTPIRMTDWRDTINWMLRAR